jgi:2',3'-cyclic-nucleotide 2'-phosphodiesterase (5'-nucleotidase family)
LRAGRVERLREIVALNGQPRSMKLSFVQMRAAAAACPLTLGLTSLAVSQTADSVELRILAINDFHGNLRPPPGGIRITDPDDSTRKTVVPAGGAERMAPLVRQLREGTRTPSWSRPAIGSCG